MGNKPSRRHHYVPRVLLRQFCSEGEKIYVMERKGSGGFQIWDRPTNIMNVCQKRDFYSYKTEKGELQTGLESWLSAIESESKRLLNQLQPKLSLLFAQRFDDGQIMDYECRRCLSEFVGIQFVRGLAFRRKSYEFVSALLKIVRNEFEMNLSSEDEAELMNSASVSAIFDLLQSKNIMLKCFLNRGCTIFQNPSGHEYLLSDEPVIISDGRIPISHPFSVPLQSKYSNIFFPVSSRHLAFFPNRKLLPPPPYGGVFCHLIPDIDSGFVDFINRGQLSNCARFVFASNKNDLSLALKLYNDDKDKDLENIPIPILY